MLTSRIRRVRDRHRDRSLGQSIVELALVLPVILLILMIGLDFGRVFLGWVNLNNAARIAANFAATNATALAGSGPIHDDAVDRYRALITNDIQTINCTPNPNPIADPAATPADLAALYPGGTDLGQIAHVSIDCDFGVITPIISNILGKTVTISASSDFPIRQGIVAGVPPGGGGSVNAAFNVSPASGVGSASSPLHVTFTDVSTGGPTIYAWDLNGDGVTDSTQVGNSPSPLTYDFTIPDVYFVSLTVSNGTDTDTATQVITVNPPPGPLVAFTATPFVGNAPLAVSFNNLSTGTNPLTYAWDFESDGTVDSTSKNPSHTYNSAGSYTVTLTVTDGNGLSNAGTKTIDVSAPIALCNVPNFTGMTTSDNIQVLWQAAGFTTTVIFNPTRGGGQPEYTIKKQDIKATPPGPQQPCNTTIQTVRQK
jgi:PKD repeat protein